MVKKVGVLIYIKPAEHGCSLYRYYTKGKHGALLLADEADAANYAQQSGLVLIPNGRSYD